MEKSNTERCAPKQKRIVNKDLLVYLKGKPCIICGSPGEAHHVTSVGSGGDDTPDNLCCLCRVHHNEWHQYGLTHMINVYSDVKMWLKAMRHKALIKAGL